MRAPFQVLVIPYSITEHQEIIFCLLKRSDMKVWQWVSGGGEEDESKIESAKRETVEELNLKFYPDIYPLDTINSVPSYFFKEFDLIDNIKIVREYAFYVEIKDINSISLSDEHTQLQWVSYEKAMNLLKWDSNKTALWELNEKLRTTTK